MKKSDTKLQELAQNGQLENTGWDSKAYIHVFRALSKEPSSKVSSHFADRVIDKIIEVQARKSARMDFLYLIIGLFGFGLAAIVLISITGFRPSTGAFAFLLHHSGLMIFTLFFIILLQWMDKKILFGNPQ